MKFAAILRNAGLAVSYDLTQSKLAARIKRAKLENPDNIVIFEPDKAPRIIGEDFWCLQEYMSA